MNFFFAIKSDYFSCELTIPKFQNDGSQVNSFVPFECFIKNNNWIIKKSDYLENENFFFINEFNINNKKIFFLSNDNEIKKNYLNLKNNLVDLNSFTDTKPIEFRCNLKIFIKSMGFSSYQSDYSYKMTKIKGSVLSPIFTLLNRDADRNFIIFKNIYYKPLEDKFNGYLIDIKNKSIVKKFELYTNFTNTIEIQKHEISDNIFFYADGFSGIPIYISLKDGHISMEHTHPPHLYILGDDKFLKINEIKNYVKKIIDR